MNLQTALRGSAALGITLLLVAAGRGQVSVTVDQASVSFNGQGPLEQDGRVLVPLRGVFEKLGANVIYNSRERTVKAVRDQTDITLTVGSRTALVNGREITLDAPTTLTNGSLLVPLRFVSENLGAEVDWNAASHTVAIDTGNRQDVGSATAASTTATPPASRQANPPGPSDMSPQQEVTPPPTAAPGAGTVAPGTGTVAPSTGTQQQAAPAAPTTEPRDMRPTPPVVVDTATESSVPDFDTGRWLPWILGALVLAGLLAYFLTRPRGGQVIAAKGEPRNP